MTAECPFSPQTANERVVRMTALITVVILLTGLFSNLKWIALLLSFDFFIRGFTTLPISPLRRGARAQVKILRLKPKMINAGPKIYAAKIGFFMALIITILSFAGLRAPARIMAEIMVLAAGLEAFLGICLGCHLYSLTQKVKKTFSNKSDLPQQN